MSLYASIDLPQTQKQAVARPSGFVGLYGNPPGVKTGNEDQYHEDDLPKDEASISHAVLQFAPSRKRQNIPSKRRGGMNSTSGINSGESLNNRNTGGEPRPDDVTEYMVTTKHIPRLEIINNFEDYADYMPEIIEHGTSQAQEAFRKKNKKPKHNLTLPQALSWDDNYDPVRPIDLDDFLRSDEHQDARKDWVFKRRALGFDDHDHNEPDVHFEHMPVSGVLQPRAIADDRPRLNFAPAISAAVHLIRTAPTQDQVTSPSDTTSLQRHMAGARSSLPPSPPPPPPPPPLLPSVTHPETAEEAYLQRATMSHVHAAASGLQSDQACIPATIHSHPVSLSASNVTRVPNPPERLTFLTTDSDTPSVPRIEYSAPPTKSLDTLAHHVKASDKHDENGVRLGLRGSAPGQKGFAQRYMAAQGWSKGQGLGSTGSGRLAPLFVKPQKDGKIGKIIDKHRQSKGDESQLSRVVLLEGMIKVDETYDENLQQHIGEACAAAYGKVERVKLVTELGRVLVKFTDAISALRCTSTVEGRMYAGNSVSARYYSEDDFEHGIWDS